MASEVENANHLPEKVNLKATNSLAHFKQPCVIIAVVIMAPFNISTVYSATTVKKHDFERSATEIWVPKNNETIQEMMRTTLQKASALLPSRGTVYFTGPGLDDVKVLARGDVSFIPIPKEQNSCYSAAESLAVQTWLETYETQRR